MDQKYKNFKEISYNPMMLGRYTIYLYIYIYLYAVSSPLWGLILGNVRFSSPSVDLMNMWMLQGAIFTEIKESEILYRNSIILHIEQCGN